MDFNLNINSQECYDANCITREFFFRNLITLSNENPCWNVDQNSLNDYKSEVKKIQKRFKVSHLDYQEEQKLIRLKCDGSREAFDKIVYSQLHLVISMARKYQNLGLSLNDLISEGNLGLLKAVENIEPRGWRISTCTKTYIKYSILNAVDRFRFPLRYPSNIVEGFGKIQRTIKKLDVINGPVSIDDIANECGIDPSVVESLLPMIHLSPGISMEYMRMAFQENDSFNDFLHSGSIADCDSIDEELEKESLTIEIDQILRKLYSQECEILKLAFGIGCKEMTLEEIGIKFDLTRERVRQIKERAIRKLKGNRSISLRQYL